MAKNRRPAGAEEATRCTHCQELRHVAPLSQWQALNLRHPVPGVFSMLRDMEAIVGPDHLVLVCIGCFCFQPVGVIRPHAMAHAA